MSFRRVAIVAWMGIVAACSGSEAPDSGVGPAADGGSTPEAGQPSDGGSGADGGTTGTEDSGTAAGFVVGPAGGSWTSPDSVVIDVPAGALDQETTIQVVPTTLPAGTDVTADSTVFRFEPEGTVFRQPISISIPYTDPSEPVSFFWSEQGQSTLDMVQGATFDGAVGTAEVTHFSLGLIGRLLSTVDCDPVLQLPDLATARTNVQIEHDVIDMAVSGSKTYLLANFRGEADLLGSTSLTASGPHDAFLAVFDQATCAVDWSVHFAGPSIVRVHDLEVDAAGDAYVLGNFRQSMQADPTHSLTSVETEDLFVAKVSSSGTVSWLSSFSVLDNSMSFAAIPVPIDLAIGPGVIGLVGQGTTNTIGFRYWSLNPGTGAVNHTIAPPFEFVQARALAYDSAGNVYFAPDGSFGAALRADYDPDLHGNMVLASYDASGSLRWTLGVDPDPQNPSVQAFVPSGRVDGLQVHNDVVYLFGHTVSLDATFTGQAVLPPPQSSTVLVEIDTTGAVTQARSFGSLALGAVFLTSNIVASDGTIFGVLEGANGNAVDIGGTMLIPNVDAPVIVSMATDLSLRWSLTLADYRFDTPRLRLGIADDGTDLRFAGSFRGPPGTEVPTFPGIALDGDWEGAHGASAAVIAKRAR